MAAALRLLPPMRDPSGRTPPHDLDAEAAVLSACMLDPYAMARIVEFLRPDHFYAEAHRRIYEACCELHAARQPIDIVQVATWLKNRERLAQVGGNAYLTEILNAAPAVVNVAAYARTVLDKARVRSMISTCQTIAAQGYLDYGDAQDFLDGAGESVDAVRRQGVTAPVERNLDSLMRVVKSIAETNERVQSGQRVRGVTGIPTGLSRYDRLTAGLHAAKLHLVAARPGIGKTALGLQLASNACAVGIGAGVISMEMTRDELLTRLISAHAGVDGMDLVSGSMGFDAWARVQEAATSLSKLPLQIDDTPSLNIRQVRARANRMIEDSAKLGAPLGLLVVDYVQWIASTPEAAKMQRREQLAEITQGLKVWAKETRIPVVALAQLNRDVDKRTGEVRFPRLSDLADSSSLEKDADQVIFLHRAAKVVDDKEELEDDGGKTWLIVAKNRGGRTGTVVLRFRKELTWFEDWGGHRDADGDE